MNQQEKKKSFGGKIVCGVALTLIILGLTLIIGSVMAGANFFDIRNKEILFVTTGNSEKIYFSDMEELSATKTEDIKRIVLDIDAAEVKVRPGAEFSLSDRNLKNGVSGDTWYIGSNEKRFYILGHSVPIVSRFFYQDSHTITIPRGADLEEIEFSVGVGEIDIDELAAKKITLNVDAGELKAEKIEADTSELSVHAGELKIDELLSGAETKLSVDVGELNIKGGSIGGIEAKCNIGELNFTGEITGNGTVKCDVGEVNMKIWGNPADFDINTKHGIGSVNVKDSNRTSGQGSGKERCKLFLETDIGDINVKFK